jgi:chaperonin GroEL
MGLGGSLMIKNRDIVFGSEAQNKVARGLALVAKAVKATLGPKGRNVLIQKPEGGFMVTKDGLAVTRSIFLADKFENMGVEVAKEVAKRAAGQQGDGSTSSQVLCNAVVQEGQVYIALKQDPMSLRRGIDAASKKALEFVRGLSIPVAGLEDLRRVATISMNGDTQHAHIVADTIHSVGHQATVTLETHSGLETTVYQTKGFEFSRGMVAPYFSTDMGRQRTLYTEGVFPNGGAAYIWLVNGRLNSVTQPLMDILNAVHATGKPLIIVAEAIEGEALMLMVKNKLAGILNVTPVKAPGFGSARSAMLGDLAAFSGATLRRTEEGADLFSDFSLDELGVIKYAEITQTNTVLIPTDDRAPYIEDRVSEIDAALSVESDDDERHLLTRRRSILTGGVATIKVGGESEAVVMEKRDLMEDAIRAVQAACAGGVLPGGGTTLLRASEMLKDFSTGNEAQDVGVEIFRKALAVPFKAIIENGGGSADMIQYNVLATPDYKYGYDAAKEEYCDMVAAGILDPTNVVLNEIEHSAAMAGLLLSTDVVIGLDDRPDPK